jgi:hypothetical protein
MILAVPIMIGMLPRKAKCQQSSRVSSYYCVATVL